MFQVKKRTLLLIAGIVWFIAGYNVARLGVLSYQTVNGWWYLHPLSVVVFFLFGTMFYKMSRKHTGRIMGYEDYRPFWNFFNKNNEDSFREYVEQFGITAPLVFLAAQMLQIFLPLLPGELMEISAGYLFGAVEGTFLCFLGIFDSFVGDLEWFGSSFAIKMKRVVREMLPFQCKNRLKNGVFGGVVGP